MLARLLDGCSANVAVLKAHTKMKSGGSAVKINVDSTGKQSRAWLGLKLWLQAAVTHNAVTGVRR